jgi:hypothetical protein
MPAAPQQHAGGIRGLADGSSGWHAGPPAPRAADLVVFGNALLEVCQCGLNVYALIVGAVLHLVPVVVLQDLQIRTAAQLSGGGGGVCHLCTHLHTPLTSVAPRRGQLLSSVAAAATQAGKPTPPPTWLSLQMLSMNMYCTLPWNLLISCCRRSCVLFVASKMATCPSAAGTAREATSHACERGSSPAAVPPRPMWQQLPGPQGLQERMQHGRGCMEAWRAGMRVLQPPTSCQVLHHVVQCCHQSTVACLHASLQRR